MISPDRLEPDEHDWLIAPATRRVIEALEAVEPHSARFVGGCVRNALLRQPVDDIDIATTLVPERAAEALKAAGIAVHETGIAHGTLTAVADHQPFEITTLRRDVSTDGRRATVAFTTDWAEDAKRRDFTLNAIYAEPDGTLIDYASGVEDALHRRILFIGKAEDRIVEDYLRILRFFRFFAWYGHGEPDPDAIAACAAMKDGLTQLSAERVWKETKKLLAAEDPRAALAAMDEAGVMAVLYGNLDRSRLDRLIEMGEADAFLRFLALCPDDAAGETLVQGMKMSNAEKDRLRTALDPDFAVALAHDWQTRAGLEKLVYRKGNQAVADRLALYFASQETPPEGWGGALAHARSFAPPVFPVAGADLLAAGLEKGPQLGETLTRLENSWVESRFALTKGELLESL